MLASPPNWYEVAKQLRDQAEALRSRDTSLMIFTDSKGQRTTRSYYNRGVFLMAGFSLENIIKAFLIYEHPQHIKHGHLAKDIRTHNLGKLWAMSSHVPYKNRFAGTVELLADGLETWARYPCGLSHDRAIYEHPMTPKLWGSYLSLFAACSKWLESLLSKGWSDVNGEKHYMQYL